MSNAVVIGRLRGVEAGAIVLDGELCIIVPPTLSVADFPIGCRVTVAVHRESDERLVAETIKRNPDND